MAKNKCPSPSIFSNHFQDIDPHTHNKNAYFRITNHPCTTRGETRTWHFSTSPLGANAHGRRLAVTMAVDVTARKQAESELEEARRIAEEANRAKSIFLANMSHEIRTPLSAILGFADLMALGSFSDAERDEFLVRIKRSGTQLAELINDVLDLAKVEAQKLSLDRAAVDLRAFLDDIRGLFLHRAAERGVSLRVFEEVELPAMVTTDPVRLRQILVNVVANALKFTSAGGRVELRTRFLPRERQLRFEISDTGIGISVENQTAIFEPFQQASTSISHQFGGTGLGLALSRRLAELLGGDLHLVRSEPGKGSTFAVTIEASETRGTLARSPDDAVPQESRPLRGLEVLVAEDVPEAQLFLRRLLESQGASVTVVDNGREAVDKAREHDFDAILMDVRMPVLDGLSATRELRESGYRRPIVALTANALVEDRRESLAAGCDDHLTKPITLAKLAGALERVTHHVAG